MQRFHLVAISIITAALTGCDAGVATVFVHNDSDSYIRVSIEGQKPLSVGNGKHARQYVPYGEHRVRVERDGKIIVDEVKNFEQSKSHGWRHYLLDPDGDTAFALYKVYYYKDQKTANKSRRSRKVQDLVCRRWVDVPEGACALEAMPVTITSNNGDRAERLCVYER